MTDVKIIRDEEPIRLFKSDFLEFFTHISPITVLVVWLPILFYFLVRTIQNIHPGGFPWYILISLIIGLFLWTFAEYTLHRFVFHFHSTSPLGQRITFLFHGIHHAQPQCKTRLVMPFMVSIPMALPFLGLFYLILGYLLKIPQWIDPMFAAFIAGYLVYDMTHYATHHFPMHSGYAKFVKRYHMQHHYKTPNQRFGVSSPLWDMVFKTMPA
jgi:dihydroceramide fatty acyl 2-hydroxylase